MPSHGEASNCRVLLRYIQVLGIFFPFFWVIAAFLPCCLPGRSVRRVAMASVIALLIYTILAIILTLTMTRRNHHNYRRPYYNQGY